MSFVVLYDANVLYPSTLRDLLIRVAQAGLVQAKWTDRILDEVFDALSANRPDLDSQRLARTRSLMNAAVRDCLVTGTSPSSRRSNCQTLTTAMCLRRRSERGHK